MSAKTLTGFDLSPQQRRIWKLWRDNPHLTGQAVVSIEGEATADALRAALDAIVRRHEILRTQFPLLPGMRMPLQVINETAAISWHEIDLAGEDARDEAVRRVAAELRAQPFDLARDPALRATLLTLSPSRRVLVLCLPALHADEATLRNLVGELAASFGDGESAEAGEPVQYVQFSEWQNELTQGDGIQPDGQLWPEDVRDAATHLRLPFEQEAERGGAARTGLHRRVLHESLAARVEEVARRYDTKSATILLACWQTLLWRLTGQPRVVVGVLFDGRTNDDLKGLLGPCAKYIPVAARCETGRTFGDLVNALAGELVEIESLQDRFEWEETRTPREEDTAAEVPFCSVGFDYAAAPESHRAQHAAFSIAALDGCHERFNLRLSCTETGRADESLVVELRYDEARYEETYVRRVAGYFEALLTDALADASRPVEELELLGADERRELLSAFNDTTTPVSEHKFAHRLFEEQAARTPDRPAVVFGAEGLTYQELNRRANQLANYLRSNGVGTEDLVGVFLKPELNLLVAMLAVMKAGAAYLPIEANYPAERVRFMLEDARAAIVLTSEGMLPLLPEHGGRALLLDAGWEKIAGHNSADDPAAVLTPDNLAYVIYTSGSTGRPKGVMVNHRGLSNYLAWCLRTYPLNAGGQGAPVHSSIAFDLTVTSLFSPLLAGEQVVLVPQQAAGLEALAGVLRASENFSFIKLTPAHIKMLSQQLSAGEAARAAKALIVGGEALLADDLAYWRQNAPDTALFNEYGPTEAVVGCCVYRVNGEPAQTAAVPIGRPIINTQLYVLDGNMRPVPVGVAGELYIGGVGVARGYLNRPGLTAERFVPHPFDETGRGARLYRTGDLVRFLPDGNLEYLGRIDTQVKVRGFRIELGEIESVLVQHESVREAVVLAREDQTGEKRLVAYVVASTAAEELNVSELGRFLREQLPDYMVPHVFVPLDELPLTPNGKVDRHALPAPDQSRPNLDSEFVAPLTLEEEILAGVWAQVLGIENIGIDDNYFAVGGDSIRSIQIVARAQERGLNFSVDDLFNNPTVRKLAKEINAAATSAASDVPQGAFALVGEADRRKLPEGIEDAYPLTMLQAGMIFHRELSPDSPIYHDISSFYVSVPLDLAQLRAALEAMVKRHAALRTWFDLTQYSEPLQIVEPVGELCCEIEDLSSLSDEEQEARVEQFFVTEKERGFDCTRLPLIRFCVHVRGENRWQFTMSFHHAILDGWSEATMVTEMFHHYMSLLNGDPVPTNPPASLFRDYVALERAILKSEAAAGYWEQKLSDNSFVTIPRWKQPDTDAPTRDIIVLEVPFSNEVSEGLKRLARATAVPIKDVLLAAHMRVMSLLSGQREVLTCVVSSGRPEGRDGDRAVGLFINSMPFNLRLPGGTWADLVTATFDVEREALPFRRYPMAEMKMRRGGIALSETLFYFTHYHVYQSFKQVPGVELLGARLYEETSFALAANFRVDPFSARVHFVLKCDGNELTAEQVEVIGEYYKRALTAMALEPTSRYEDASLLPEQELHKLLVEWNGDRDVAAAAAAAPPLALHQLFERQVARTPEATAVVFQEERLTYHELNQRANQLASYLRKLNVAPDMLVGLCVERSPELVVGILGILKAGGAYVPLDVDYPKERLEFILRDSQAAVLVTQERLRDTLSGVAAEIVCLDTQWPEIAQEPSGDPAPAATADNTAYIIYTSGSTGQPKGVVIPQRNVVRLFESTKAWYNFDEKDVWTLFHSYGFDFSVWELWGALLHGGKLVVVPQLVARAPEAFYELLLREGVTVLNQTPSAFRQLMGADENSARADELALRLVIFGGEALEFASLKPWFARHGDERPQLVNMYGITETTVHVTYQPLTAADAEGARGSVIGRPIPDLRVYVLDENLQPAPVGAPGQIYVAGAGLARGYLARPELTAERFIANPYATGADTRLYKTGDLARYLPSGELEYLGRVDQQVKIRGFRIELGEIEVTLSRHEGVREVAVVAREDRPGEKRLVAYVVPRGGEGDAELTTSELRRFLNERLPGYMVPAVFMLLDALPFTAHGKIDRDRLPAPDQARPELESAYVTPRDETEEVMANIWAQALDVERVGIHDNFFELGGHSLLATLVIARIREAFEINLPLRALYEAPTVEALARSLTQSQLAPAGEYTPLPTIVPDPENRHVPFQLTDIQQAYWVGRQEGFELGDTPAHIYLEFDADGLDFARLQRVVKILIERHDMLRAIMLPDGRQQILQNLPDYEIELTDLRGQEAGETEARIAEVRGRMSHQMFETDQWPLFEIKVHQLGAQHYRLHFSIDLLITDADSLGILNRELGQLYQNPEAALPPLELSFRDYVLGELELRQTELYRESKAYWLGRLDSLPPSPALPLVADYGHLEEKHFTRLRGGLDAESWKRLKARAARSGITPSGVLLAAYSEVLALWSKTPRFSVNVTTYNCLPLHPQARDLVGDFTSLTLVAVDSTQETFEARAKSIQRQFVEDMDHNYFGGIEVMRELAKRRGASLQAAMPIVFTSTLPLHTREGNRQAPFPIELVAGVTQSPQTLLDHQVSEELGALTVRWDYMVEAFPENVIEEMFAAYGRLLHRLAEDEDGWHERSRRWLLPEAQRLRHHAANNTAAPLPEGLLHSAFYRQAEQRPDAPAVITPALTLSYAQLRRQAARLAAQLRREGVEPNQLVAVVMTKGWEQVVAVLGVLEAGAAYLPIDALLPAKRRNYLLETGRVSVAVTQPWLEDALVDWPQHVTRLTVELSEAADSEGAGKGMREETSETLAPPAPVQRPEDLAYVIFTSGSTGQPKGVMISHQAALNTVADINARFRVGAHDRVLGLSSLSFDLSVYDIFGLLSAGGALVLPESDATRDPAHWLELTRRAGVTVWNSVPALMEMLVEYTAGRGEELPESLRLALLSGDWIGLSLPGRLREVRAGIEVVSLGGATEASIWSIMYPVEGEVQRWWRSIPYGHALLNQGVHVLNEWGEECPDWVTGELYITGAGVAEGYWGDEERTRAQFGEDTERGGRWYRTGDVGRWMGNGEIEFLGREDEQVKVQGHRIELGEVERALEEHEGVRQAVAAAQGGGDGRAGSNKRLVAYVVLRQQDAPAEEREAAPSSNLSSQEAAASSKEAALSASVLLDLEARKTFKEKQPGLREINGDHPKVDLAFTTSPEEAAETYFRRRTHYTFSDEPITLDQFASFLGCLRQLSLDGKPKYRYGSGGGLYPVQTYVHAKPGGIEGLDAGAYYYHPLRHELIRLSNRDTLDENIHWPANRATVKGSAFSIFLVAEMDAIAPMYGSAARDFCLLEAGMMAQLLETEGAADGVGLCQIGSLDFPRIRDLFQLKESHVLLHSLVGGRAVHAQPGRAELPSGNGRAKEVGVAGDGETRQASLATARASVTVDELRDYLREKLPEYMIPSAFVVLDALPMSPNGKVDRKNLPQPEASPQESAAAFIAPQTEMQEVIAKAIQDELHLERVGIRDNFFELGATSLILVKVHHRLCAALQLDFPVVTLFRYPTIESLTENLGREEKRGDEGVDYSERASKQRAARRRRREKHVQDT